MSTMNEMLSPPPPTNSHIHATSPSAKRKRDDTIEARSGSNGVSESKGAELPGEGSEASRALIRDLVDVLKGSDTTPSILTRSLPERPSSSGPQSKRQKSEETSETTPSIIARLAANAYNHVTEVLQDIDTSVADIMEKLQVPNGAARNQYIPVSATQSETSMQVNAFKQRAHALIDREMAAMGNTSSVKLNSALNASSFAANGGLGPNSASPAHNKMVLTLYGNAPGPKQLFSSLQLPSKANGEEKDIIQTLREAGLPNGITTTQIIPVQATGLADDKKRIPTLGELFPTPSSVPAMLPPKPSKVSTTRSSTVGWYQPSLSEPVSRSASYFKQSISYGQWLDYSNATGSQQGTKRKPRDRTLSMNAGKASSLEIDPAESEASKLEALFRGAYSSFAPTKDDHAAVVPTGVMNRMWWQQVGERSFEKLVRNYEDMDIAASDTPMETDAEPVEDVAVYEKSVEEYINDQADHIDPSLTSIEKSAEEKDVEEILQGISELLETLNSYQRIRHLSLNASSRPVPLLSGLDTPFVGTPSKPGESEQITYEILKSQMTLMIASLPPYAVAKLDPDRLADLGVSTRIEVHTNDYRGVMEEDEAAARAKVAALSSASAAPRPAAPAPINRSSSTAAYSNQYTAARPSPSPAPHQYYNPSQTPIRPPQTNLQRPPATAPAQYQPIRPPGATPYRPPQNYATPSYPHQAPRPVQQPYNPQQFGQNYMQPQRRPSAPPGQMLMPNGHYAAYPPTTGIAPPAGYYSNGANINRQASPQKPMYSPQPQNAQPQIPQPRLSYGTPTPSIPQASRPYSQNSGQTPVANGMTPQHPQSQMRQPVYNPQASSITDYSTFRTTEQQSNMMERQRAQLAASSQPQQQARAVAQAAAMGSPSKAQVNGSNPVAAGL